MNWAGALLVGPISYLTTSHSADGRGSSASADGDANGLAGRRYELSSMRACQLQE
jgi:hypothetical protein